MEEEHRKIYLAGIWDADGCFGISKRSGRWMSYQPFAIITLTDKKAPFIFGLLEHDFGFKCVWNSRRDNPKWNVAHRWLLSSQKACDFAAAIEPYLIIKKERAQILMEWPKIENDLSFKQRIPLHERQTGLYERMKLLNKRGT